MFARKSVQCYVVVLFRGSMSWLQQQQRVACIFTPSCAFSKKTADVTPADCDAAKSSTNVDAIQMAAAVGSEGHCSRASSRIPPATGG